MKKTWICLMALMSSSFTVSAGEFSLSKNMVHFEKNAQQRDVVMVKSHLPNQNVYFSTRVREVLSPEKGIKSQYAEYDSPFETGLFVTPNKAVITPREGQVPISIVNTNTNLTKERVYRVDVKPSIPPIPSSGKSEARLKVLVAYDFLVFVQPSVPTLDYQFRFDPQGQFTFINQGNTHVMLKNGKQCNAKQECTSLNGGRVFAGSEASVSVADGTVSVGYDIVLRGQSKDYVVFEK